MRANHKFVSEMLTPAQQCSPPSPYFTVTISPPSPSFWLPSHLSSTVGITITNSITSSASRMPIRRIRRL